MRNTCCFVGYTCCHDQTLGSARESGVIGKWRTGGKNRKTSWTTHLS